MTSYVCGVVTQMDPKLLHNNQISTLCVSQSLDGGTTPRLCTRRSARLTFQIHAGALELTSGIQMPKHRG